MKNDCLHALASGACAYLDLTHFGHGINEKWTLTECSRVFIDSYLFEAGN